LDRAVEIASRIEAFVHNAVAAYDKALHCGSHGLESFHVHHRQIEGHKWALAEKVKREHLARAL
jgi:hypothetical protein